MLLLCKSEDSGSKYMCWWCSNPYRGTTVLISPPSWEFTYSHNKLDGFMLDFISKLWELWCMKVCHNFEENECVTFHVYRSLAFWWAKLWVRLTKVWYMHNFGFALKSIKANTLLIVPSNFSHQWGDILTSRSCSLSLAGGELDPSSPMHRLEATEETSPLHCQPDWRARAKMKEPKFQYTT